MLIFVDCEAYGGAPVTGQLTWFGAAAYPKLQTWGDPEGIIVPSRAAKNNPAIPEPTRKMSPYEIDRAELRVFSDFRDWLARVSPKQRVVFVSDNVAFDWQWINHGFHKHLGENPFGHSGRRISDFYAGLQREWGNTQKWKRYRITKHDHNPVHDALGNAEAFRRILEEAGLEPIG